MSKKPKKSLLSSLASFTNNRVKNTDIFGKNVSFNFGGEECVKTLTGGVVSVLVYIGLLYMIISYSIVMFRRERNNISTNVLISDIDNSPVRHYIGRDGYSFSVNLRDVSGRIHDFDPSYVRVSIDQLSITKTDRLDVNPKVTLTNLGSKSCYQQFVDMLGKETADLFQSNKAVCPVNSEYYISGSSFSNDYGAVKITLVKCFGNGCKPSAEIDEYLKGKTLFVGLLNYYFDTEDYEDPIKFRFEGNYNWGILPGYYLTKNVRIASNYADDKKSYRPFGSQTQYKYYSVGKVFENMLPQQQGQPLLEVTLEVDDTYSKIERSVFTLTDMASVIGGLLEIYLLFGAFLAGFFTDKIYYSKLLSHLYQVITPKPDSVSFEFLTKIA